MEKKNNYNGSIYGTPIKINSTILPNEKLIILEMNNSTNKIEGIGFIKNMLFHDKYKIYKDNNYNRYIYKSNKYINITDFNEKLKKILKILEHFLFKTKNIIKEDMVYKNYQNI